MSSFKMSRDTSNRVFPESGIKTPFHTMSHHGSVPSRIDEYAKLNRYHMRLLPYFLEKMRSTPDGDGNLLDHSLDPVGQPDGRLQRARAQAPAGAGARQGQRRRCAATTTCGAPTRRRTPTCCSRRCARSAWIRRRSATAPARWRYETPAADAGPGWACCAAGDPARGRRRQPDRAGRDAARRRRRSRADRPGRRRERRRRRRHHRAPLGGLPRRSRADLRRCSPPARR